MPQPATLHLIAAGSVAANLSDGLQVSADKEADFLEHLSLRSLEHRLPGLRAPLRELPGVWDVQPLTQKDAPVTVEDEGNHTGPPQRCACEPG